jgi:phosphoglycolate phosphatase
MRAVRPDAIVFDLDGTLWDTCGTCADAWNRVLATLGIPYRPITPADVRAVAGQPHLEGIRATFPDLDDARVGRIADATAHEDNAAVARDGGILYPGVLEHVPSLRRRLPLFIVSNCQRGYVETFLQWSRLAPAFVDFECWGNTGNTKAANLAAVIARNHLRAPFFVGDTEGDRTAADANNVPFVYASYGFGHVTQWAHRIDRFDQLPALL